MDNAIATEFPAGLKVTYPYEAIAPGVARVQCEECGKWQRADNADKGLLVGEIAHSKSCESRPQIAAVATALSVRAAKAAGDQRLRDLRRFADQVRRTGLTHGRDADVAECVKLGLLAAGDAMNSDV